MILVEAHLFGGSGVNQSGSLIVDTGAGFLALDQPVAKQLGLIIREVRDFSLTSKPLARLELGSVGGRRNDNLQLDQISPVMVIDLDVVHRVTDRDILGLIGESVFHGRALHVDYGDRTLAVIPAPAGDLDVDETSAAERISRSRGQFTNALLAGATPVPFRVAGDGKIMVEVRVSDPEPPKLGNAMTLILDTGATKSALFGDKLEGFVAQRDKWKTLSGLSAQHLYGNASVDMVRIPRVELMADSKHVSADDVVFGVMTSELASALERSVGETVHGVLGYTFLRRFDVLIDYPRQVLWFSARDDWDDRPNEYTHVGLQLERDGEDVRIRSVATDSPAARKNIRAGDILTEVDNESIESLGLIEITRRLEGTRGSIVRVTVRRGRMRVTYSLVRRELL